MRVCKIETSTVGAYTVERRRDGFRVVETETGVSSGTFESYKLAMDDVRTMQYQKALVKVHGIDGAIEILSGRASIHQSAT